MPAFERAAKLSFLSFLICGALALAAQQAGQLPTPKEGDYVSHDFHFNSGESLPEL